MITIERISHFAAAVVTDPTHTLACCSGLLSAARLCGAATSKYSPSSHRLRPRLFTSDVRIPEFWIHISSTHHSASTLMSVSAITRFTVTSFAACDVAYCNLHDRFLVLFAMSFLDTRILIRKCSNIPTFSLRGVRWWRLHSNRHRPTASDGH